MRIIATLWLFGYTVLSLAQSGATNLYLQACWTNNFLINPGTATNTKAPGAEILINATTSDDTIRKPHAYYIVGLGYTSTRQQFSVIWLGNPAASNGVDFYTNEFLLTTGGSIKLPLGKRLSFWLPFLFQLGQNYTWATAPADKISMVSVTAQDWWQDMQSPAGAHYKLRYRDAQYKWAYLQLYFSPGINLSIKLRSRISLYTSLRSRIFLFRDYVGEEPPHIQFNYARLKCEAQLGLLLKLFK